MPELAGLIEETEDELCIEEGTANVADDGTITIEMSEPLIAFLQPETDGTLNFCNVSDISGQDLTASIVDNSGASVTGAIDVRYLAIGYK